MAEPVRRLAIFDLDGTLTWTDTLLPYLLGFLRRHPSLSWRLWRVPIALIEYLRSGLDRGRLKQQLIQIAMAGVAREQIAAWSDDFANQVVAAGCRPGALRTLNMHRQSGDYLVLLSASPDLYVPVIGKLLGFDRIICTHIEFVDDRLTGRLLSENRRGEEKLRCVEHLRKEFPEATASAFGNSASDISHLRSVNRPLLVNAGRRARTQARRENIPTGDWT